MSTAKGSFPIAWKNIDKFNKRLPVKLDREQADLAKKLRKPRNKDAFQSLETLYDYLSRFFSYAKGLVACTNGCSYCCHSEIGLSQIEADYIAAKTGISTKRLEFDPTRKGAAPWADPGRPCPFVKDNACSIYALRPMTCRTHFNFEATNELCRFDSHAESMPMLDREKSLAGAMKAYGEIVSNYGGGVGDIREFFGETSVVSQVPSPGSINI